MLSYDMTHPVLHLKGKNGKEKKHYIMNSSIDKSSFGKNFDEKINL
jgi:hypothetical protein